MCGLFTKGGNHAILDRTINSKYMPELPEIETIRRGLLEKVLEKPILSVRVNNEEILRSPRRRFTQTLKGKEFISIGRRGKMLIFTIAEEGGEPTGRFFLARLGMTGRLVYFDEENGSREGNSYARKKSYAHAHCHFILGFESSGSLLFCDSRKFGYLEIVDEAGLEAKLRRFGPEPLDKSFTWQALEKILDKRKVSIKALLLNQECIAGIGNIYADEILFDAGIMPTRRASLEREEIRSLHRSMKRILKKAVEKRGTSFSDYVDAAGEKGNFQNFLKIYGRQGKPCIGCSGIVERMVVAGRGTNFCRSCQK